MSHNPVKTVNQINESGKIFRTVSYVCLSCQDNEVSQGFTDRLHGQGLTDRIHSKMTRQSGRRNELVSSVSKGFKSSPSPGHLVRTGRQPRDIGRSVREIWVKVRLGPDMEIIVR